MWQAPGAPPVVTQQPQAMGPYPMQQQIPMNQFPQGPYPTQQFPMNQFPQGQYPPPMYPGGQPQGYAQPGVPYGQPQMPMQQSGGSGMLNKVMGVVNEVVDVNPMSEMYSTGNAITGYKGPPLMPLPPVENCPVGLEFLLNMEHLFVKQQAETMEALLAQVGVPFETPNRYDIVNDTGCRIYFAAETGGLLQMQCSPTGSMRPFKIIVLDFSGRTVLTIERSWSCLFCCLTVCNCCGSTGTRVKVTLGDGSYLGEVVQKYNCCTTRLVVKDDAGNYVCEIKGPGCGDCCCSCTGCCVCCGCDVKFKVKNPDGDEIGCISKKWSGIFLEGLTDADNFGVKFPRDMDVRCKAMLMGAVFLIDFMFFEENPRKDND